HHSQKEIDNNPDYSVFSYYIKPTFDFRQELLSNGADVEVLEPKWFRDEIAAIIFEQYKIYRNDEL
ncbi:MAG TPA: WYL domain-containing protein, partial [Macellibacteroides fermentans]|nr:WYL domain-containing protein [Macellibacteroides fermentans]